MSWLYSRALVEAFSAGTCSAGEPSALSNGSPTPRAYLSPDRMTAFSRLSRFGMTFAPLTDDRGAELLMWFREASRARTSALQEKAPALTGSAPGCGPTWRGSFAKYDPKMSLWRTHQCSLVEGLDEFLETWPRWGLMRGGECWEQEPSAPFINESEFGLSLPTTGANEWRGASKKRYVGSPHFRGAKMSEGLRTCEEDPEYLNPSFAEIVMGWPLGWTDLEPLATDKSRSAPLKRGESLQEVEA